MASKYICDCGEIIRTNLFSGHGVRLLVPEELLDVEETETSTHLVDRLVLESLTVAQCQKCGKLALIDNEYKIKLYAPVL